MNKFYYIIEASCGPVPVFSNSSAFMSMHELLFEAHFKTRLAVFSSASSFEVKCGICSNSKHIV